MRDFLKLSRRQVLSGGAALAATAAFYPRISVSQDGKVLRVRSYADIQVLDPAYRKAAPEDDIMRCVLVGLVGNKAGDIWGWEPLDFQVRLSRDDNLRVDLARADRDLILRLKAEARARPGYYGVTISAFDIYQFAIANAGTTLRELEDWKAGQAE